MGTGGVHITGRLDRKLTKTERAKLAATEAGKKTLKLLREKSPIIKERLKKEAPKVKSIVKSIGKTGWEIFKRTSAGKRLDKKIKKQKKSIKKAHKTSKKIHKKSRR